MSNEIVVVKKMLLESRGKTMEVESQKGYETIIEVYPVSHNDDGIVLSLDIDDVAALIDFLKMVIEMQCEDD